MQQVPTKAVCCIHKSDITVGILLGPLYEQRH
jgi:hypothetical protein